MISDLFTFLLCAGSGIWTAGLTDVTTLVSALLLGFGSLAAGLLVNQVYG